MGGRTKTRIGAIFANRGVDSVISRVIFVIVIVGVVGGGGTDFFGSVIVFRVRSSVISRVATGTALQARPVHRVFPRGPATSEKDKCALRAQIAAQKSLHLN